MLTFSRRFSAVLVALACTLGSPAVCSGWLPTAEARMACCSDESGCPMHAADPGPAERVLTQVDADRCCAASEPDDAASSNPAAALLLSAAPAVAAPLAAAPEPDLRARLGRASAPLPPDRIPRHLRLSVLLV